MVARASISARLGGPSLDGSSAQYRGDEGRPGPSSKKRLAGGRERGAPLYLPLFVKPPVGCVDRAGGLFRVGGPAPIAPGVGRVACPCCPDRGMSLPPVASLPQGARANDGARAGAAAEVNGNGPRIPRLEGSEETDLEGCDNRAEKGDRGRGAG